MTQRIFYISDTHFGHNNVIYFDKRPFEDSEEMDKEMIARWNDQVKRGDHVYIVGDFIWTKPNAASEYLSKLNGHKHLILGNHDKGMGKEAKTARFFASIQEIKTIKDDGRKVFMCHYPIPWFPLHRNENSVHLFGHTHLTLEFYKAMEGIKSFIEDPNVDSKAQYFNVGANLPYMNYTPQTLDRIIKEGSQFNRKVWGGEYREVFPSGRY